VKIWHTCPLKLQTPLVLRRKRRRLLAPATSLRKVSYIGKPSTVKGQVINFEKSTFGRRLSSTKGVGRALFFQTFQKAEGFLFFNFAIGL